MFIPSWVLVGVAGVLVAWGWFRRYARHHAVRSVRAWWARLPRWRREEILYMRERLHRNGAKHLPDYGSASDAHLEEWFENSLRNALDGDAWAFELLKEQITSHAWEEGLMRAGGPAAHV